MNLGSLALGAFLLLYAMVSFGWLAVSNILMGVVAFIAGILLLLAGFEVYPRRRA